KASGDEFAALTQAVLIDAVADSWRDMPFRRNTERSQALRRVEQRLNRNQLVRVAVDQQDGWPTANLGREGVRYDMLRRYQHSRIANDPRRRDGAAQANMKRHHGALTEANQSQRRRRKIAALELGVEKAFENRCSLVHAGPALVRIAESEREPFTSDRRLAAGTWCMWRDKCSIGQESLPGASDVDQIVAVSAIAMQENHQLA